MTLTKSLYDLTSVFIRMDRLLLVLLIAFPISISVPGHFVYEMINKLVKAAGVICVLSWLYAIAYKCNEYLESRNIPVRVFSWVPILYSGLLLLGGIFFFIAKKVVIYRGGARITYTEPIALVVIMLLTHLLLASLVAKILVSAEKEKEVSFREYWTTALLLLIPPIGVWFVQPRVQKL